MSFHGIELKVFICCILGVQLIKMMIKGLIAVRSGSERVKQKNIRSFGGSNILTIKIQQLLQIPKLDSVIVNSNDDEMLSLAKSLGCETIKRNDYFASSKVCMSDVYENMAISATADILLYANATNPLIRTETINAAIEAYFEGLEKYDSLNTATIRKEFLFQNNKPINYDLKNQPRSQDLPEIYALNFAVNIISRSDMIKYKNIVGHYPQLFKVSNDEAIDIDSPFDFAYAEFLYKKKQLEVKDSQVV